MGHLSDGPHLSMPMIITQESQKGKECKREGSLQRVHTLIYRMKDIQSEIQFSHFCKKCFIGSIIYTIELTFFVHYDANEFKIKFPLSTKLHCRGCILVES